LVPALVLPALLPALVVVVITGRAEPTSGRRGKPKLHRWYTILIRKKGEFLGVVEALDEAARP
jgi:hypothetical protein